MTEEEEIAEIGRLRAEYRRWQEYLCGRYHLPDVDDWARCLREAPTNVGPGWGIAFHTRILHPLGDELSGLVVVPSDSSGARIHWRSRTGLSFMELGKESKVELRSGLCELEEPARRDLQKACKVAWRRGLHDVPPPAYDETPVTLVLAPVRGREAQRANDDAFPEVEAQPAAGDTLKSRIEATRGFSRALFRALPLDGIIRASVR